MKTIATIAVLASTLGGCTTGSSPQSPGDQSASSQTPAKVIELDPNAPFPERDPEQECKHEPVQKYVGQVFTERLGQAILSESNSRQIRHSVQGSPWTSDYRFNRVNVTYDDKMKILTISCG